jgi:hypothetical protein
MSVRNMMIGGAGARVPDAPTGVSAGSATTTTLSVSFSAPADNGGSAITGFTVTSSPGGVTASGASSPITVTGLTASTSYTFTVTATNAIGTSVASSPSSAVSTAADVLWVWPLNTDYSFDNLSATGPDGPSESTINNAYSGAPFKSDAAFFSAISGVTGIQRLRIPQDGTYRITAYGAKGADSGTFTGGNGAIIQVTGPLTKGQDILMVVGQEGTTDSASTNGGGGGGGTFVYLLNGAGYDQYVMSDIIVAAGGGGGALRGSGSNGVAASTGMLGAFGTFSTSSGIDTSYTRPAPGYGGICDHVANNGRNYAGGPGAGFFTRGQTISTAVGSGASYTYFGATSGASFNTGSNVTIGSSNGPNYSGSSFGGNSGRTGEYGGQSDMGTGIVGFSGPWVGGRGDNATPAAHGGFGGGGGGATGCGGTGAGGGFSGGIAHGCSSTSGAGGSYGRASADGFTGWSVTSTAATSGPHGLIVIRRTA